MFVSGEKEEMKLTREELKENKIVSFNWSTNVLIDFDQISYLNHSIFYGLD